MANGGSMKDRGWNPHRPAAHTEVNNKAFNTSTSNSEFSSAGRTAKSSGGSKDGSPPVRKGGSLINSGGTAQKVGQNKATGKDWGGPKAGR